MSTITATCTCGSIGRTDLRQCPDHFYIWNGDVRLTSVGRIAGLSFPLDPSIPTDVLENARDRGSEVDKLFAAYCLGKLRAIPSGTRNDARDLFLKAMKWFDRQRFKKVEVQVLLGVSDYGGVLDFRFDGIPCDLKCTYNVEESAKMQVAGYVDLCGYNGGHILHVTERYAEPRLVNILMEEVDDWRVMLAHWRMLKRRGVFKKEEARV